jgi:hypothetical protein
MSAQKLKWFGDEFSHIFDGKVNSLLDYRSCFEGVRFDSIEKKLYFENLYLLMYREA